MEKMATKQYTDNVSIVGSNKENKTTIKVLTPAEKQARYDKKMRRYRKNIANRKADDKEKTSIVIKKVLNKELSAQFKMPILEDKKLISNIDKYHNAIPKFNKDKYTDGVYDKKKKTHIPNNLTKKEIIEIFDKKNTGATMTRDTMNRGIVQHKIEKWDNKRSSAIKKAPKEQQGYLMAESKELRSYEYKRLLEKYNILTKMKPTTRKENLKYGVVIVCEYVNSNGMRKVYMPFRNYHIATKEYAAKLMQDKIDYFKSHMKKNHYFVKGKVLFGGEDLMFCIKARFETPVERMAA